MKRGMKLGLLVVGSLIATAAMVFLVMNVALVTVSSVSSTHERFQKRDSRLHDGATLTRTTYQRVTRRSTDVATVDTSVDCGVDRSFAPQCVGVTPTAWKLHRTVQAVGRMVIDNTYCTGVLLGNTTNAYFLTAARCLPSDKMVEDVQIEFENCIGAQVFSHSELLHLNRELDFVIFRLSTRGFSIGAHYGFLHLRPSGPLKEEVVFVPHYTNGYAKRITILNDQGLVRVTQPATASSQCLPTSAAPASRVQFTAARLDDAAVGSPVVSLSDYSMVALHLCGGCKSGGGTNTALSTASIIDDLQAAGNLIPSFVTTS